MKYVPKHYQERAIREMRERFRLGLFLDPGLGKTSSVLTAFAALRDDFEADRMLVIAPLAVCYNVWGQEAAKWDHLQHLRVEILHGPKKAEALARPADIYVINPEGVKWLSEQTWDWPDTLVLDESTRFKRPGTAKFRALRKLLRHFVRRYILTGTPTPNGLLDLFGQIYCLDNGAALGRSMTDFKQAYFIPVPRGDYSDWVERRGAAAQIYERLGPLVLRLEGADLDLPELAVLDIPVELPAAATGLYQRLRTAMVAEMDQGEVVALNAGALTSKCRQLANGRIYLDDLPGGTVQRPDGEVEGRPFAHIHDAKTEAIKRLVDELGGKSVLFSYEFKHDLLAIQKAVGGELPVLKGTDQRLVNAWNAGAVPYMAAHPKSAGHGLNLQGGGSILVMISPPYDLELYDQMIGRLYRQGQADRVFVYRLVARGTVDGTAARVLGTKGADQRALLDALREDLTKGDGQ